MISERKSFKETQLQKEVQQLKSENARLKDCILLQQKIIEKQRKQKLIFKEELKRSFEKAPYHSLRLGTSKRSNASDDGECKLVKCLTSRTDIEYNTCQTPKLSRLGLSNNDSRKTTEELIDDSLNNEKGKKKLLTLKNFKQSQHCNSSTLLYRPSHTESNPRRKSYLQKLAQQIAKE